LSSRIADPRPILFAEEAKPAERTEATDSACGFYWTEGLRGLGWAVDAVPTLKGGSGVGIPSPPAIWCKATDEIAVPDIRDAERLQGFPAGWTEPAVTHQLRRNGPRWKLVGNAVSVPVARWMGERLRSQDAWEPRGTRRQGDGSWPRAAWGAGGHAYVVDVSTWPCAEPYVPLGEFLRFPRAALSHRATTGFLERARRSSLRFAPGFIEAVERHAERTRDATVVPQAA
jgi:DNA (cytosine-5)-methyltransferase 1